MSMHTYSDIKWGNDMFWFALFVGWILVALIVGLIAGSACDIMLGDDEDDHE